MTTLFLAFGGASSASNIEKLIDVDILSGTPVAWLMNGYLLPIYIAFHYLVFHISIFSRLWGPLLLILDPFFNIFLCIAKGFSLVNGILLFKDHATHSHLTQTSYMGQLIVGILSSCGSTILYLWIIAAWNHIITVKNTKKRTKKSLVTIFPHPGYDFYVSLVVSLVIIVLSDNNLVGYVRENMQLTFIYNIPSRQDLSVISTILILISTLITI